jgi:hypothetical protein
VILVTGRSNGGTRVPIRLLREALVKGDKSGSVGGENDTYCIMQFSHRWVEKYALYGETDEMVDAWTEVLGELKDDGVAKEARMTYYLPFVDRHTPDLKVIHIIRDIRDHIVLEGSERGGRVDNRCGNIFSLLSDRQVEYMSRSEVIAWEWVRRHIMSHEYGINRMGDRYMFLRLEDIVEEPVEHAKKILAFADRGADPASVSDWIRPRESIGRWRKRADEMEKGVWAKAVGIARPALVRFGYTE